MAEEMILVALGLSSHWDLKETGLSPLRYRLLLAHILEPYHFFECLTDEPNIGMDLSNILLVRTGKNVEREVMGQLFQRLRFFLVLSFSGNKTGKEPGEVIQQDFPRGALVIYRQDILQTSLLQLHFCLLG